MTDKNTYWLTDGAGTYALATGAEERDRLLPLGWSECSEPTGDTGFVHAWREGIAEPGTPALGYFREVLSHNGWVAGPPPGGEHPAATTDAADKSDGPAPKSKPSKSAAGGVEKE